MDLRELIDIAFNAGKTQAECIAMLTRYMVKYHLEYCTADMVQWIDYIITLYQSVTIRDCDLDCLLVRDSE